MTSSDSTPITTDVCDCDCDLCKEDRYDEAYALDHYLRTGEYIAVGADIYTERPGKSVYLTLKEIPE